VGLSDVKGVLDAEATRAAAGCDEMQCASEIAGALDAPELLLGQLGHVGGTWILTLSRVDRTTLTVISRGQARAEGESPDVLVAVVPLVVDQAFGAAPPLPPLVVAGAVTTSVGLGVAIGGGVLSGIGAARFSDAKALVDASESEFDAEAAAIREAWEPLSNVGWIALASGGVLVVVGAGVTAWGLAE
jgi:hypothetical protein